MRGCGLDIKSRSLFSVVRRRTVGSHLRLLRIKGDVFRVYVFPDDQLMKEVQCKEGAVQNGTSQK